MIDHYYRCAPTNGCNILMSIQSHDFYIVQTIDYYLLMTTSPIRSSILSISANRIAYSYTISLLNLPTVFNLSILSPFRSTSTIIGGRIIRLNDGVGQSQRRGIFFAKFIRFEHRLLRHQPSGIHLSTMGFGPSILRLFAKTFDQTMGQT